MGHRECDPLPIYLYYGTSTIWPQVHAKLKGILSTPIQATICNDQTKKYCLTKLHFSPSGLTQLFFFSPLEVRKQVIHLSFDTVFFCFIKIDVSYDFHNKLFQI